MGLSFSTPFCYKSAHEYITPHSRALKETKNRARLN